MDRRVAEIELVDSVYGPVETGPELDWFIIPTWPLVPGWNRSETPILVRFPPGYATTPPDNFYADPGLRLACGQLPANASTDQQCASRPWLMFSYHIDPTTWKPQADVRSGHNMLTFFAGVDRRLRQVN